MDWQFLGSTSKSGSAMGLGVLSFLRSLLFGSIAKSRRWNFVYTSPCIRVQFGLEQTEPRALKRFVLVLIVGYLFSPLERRRIKTHLYHGLGAVQTARILVKVDGETLCILSEL